MMVSSFGSGLPGMELGTSLNPATLRPQTVLVDRGQAGVDAKAQVTPWGSFTMP